MIDTLRALGRPKVATMAALGFSSGLPFLLTGNTLGYWLREGHVSLSAISFAAWVGLAYTFKFLWAPIIDRVDAPIFRLGRRRGWMLTAQILIALGLAAMAVIGPAGGLLNLAAAAVVVAAKPIVAIPNNRIGTPVIPPTLAPSEAIETARPW